MATKPKLTKQESMRTADGHYRCGYSVADLDHYADRWKCVFCKLMIKEPYQIQECGHRVCRGCFESRAATMQDDEKRRCPASDCEDYFKKDEFMVDRAFKREQESMKVICIHRDTGDQCTWSGLLKSYQEHLDNKHNRHTCLECGEEVSSAEALRTHRESQCSAIFQKCPLAPYCTDELIRKEAFSEHFLSEKHQETIALIVSGKISTGTANSSEDSMETTSADQELEQKLGGQLFELGETIEHFSNDVVESNKDLIKLNQLSETVNTDLNRFQGLVNERNSWLNNLQIKQLEIQKDVDDLRQKLEENQYVSTDGTLTWRIDNVAERMNDAQSERQPSIFSPVFYSSPQGYKMRARLYLYGDGSARRTHISLFFSLMKGEYDEILQWPFHYKVTFCLFDQTETRRHVIDSFRPDVKSNSFQKPTGPSNIASGIPKFFPLPMLQQDNNPYVRDDTMFIKIMVDLNETPKVVLPFLFQLNPGLPYHVQQHLINQERNKQQNSTSAHTTVTVTNCA